MILQNRNDLACLINEIGCKCGIELGVAAGEFSGYLLSNSCLEKLYSVDKWDEERGHDKEYGTALRKLSAFGNRSCILRMSFDEALKRFPDGYFDFIYIDGFAFTGNRKEIFSWWQKLKRGGIYSGHDYCPEYRLVKEAVDDFVKKYSIKNLATTKDSFCSWVIIKNNDT